MCLPSCLSILHDQLNLGPLQVYDPYSPDLDLTSPETVIADNTVSGGAGGGVYFEQRRSINIVCLE